MCWDIKKKTKKIFSSFFSVLPLSKTTLYVLYHTSQWWKCKREPCSLYSGLYMNGE